MNAEELNAKYRGPDGLYAAMLVGTLESGDEAMAWDACTNDDFGMWVASHGRLGELLLALERDKPVGASRIVARAHKASRSLCRKVERRPEVHRVSSFGAQRIMDERIRQILQEGFNEEHDDGHREGSIIEAAIAYADEPLLIYAGAEREDVGVPNQWPWEPSAWKPSADPIRNLIKAGALIAAEIDRLERKRGAE
jgi:hypothetical protein